MEKYILIDSCEENYNAGYKAVDDIKSILINQDFVPIYLKMKRSNLSFIKYFMYIKYSMEDKKKLVQGIEMGSTVVVQIPVRFPQYILLHYLRVLRKRKCKIVGFIHDVEQLRYKSWNIVSKMESIIFKYLSEIIVHNDKMKNYFIEIGYKEEHLHSIEIFDYLVEGSLKPHFLEDADTIVVAGNLLPEKAGYIYKMDELFEGIKVKLYGVNYRGDIFKNIDYCGKFPSDKIPDIISQKDNLFGLVWDGDSVDECAGMIGRYQMYNNPHKLSLYLSAGLPVIVWNKAASSSFVRQNKVGICVESLAEIKSKIDSMSKYEKEELCRNAFEMGNKLRQGYYTVKVINEIF